MSQVEGAPKGTLDFICNRSLEILHDTSFKYSQSNLKVWCKDRQIDFNDSTKRNLQDALQALRWGGQLDGWETWRATVLVNQIIRESQENRSVRACIGQ